MTTLGAHGDRLVCAFVKPESSLRLPPTDRPLKVVCLDGGGMRGLFTAAFIAGLEDVLKRPLIDCVDLLVGTSTGGLIALGLASSRSGSEMVDLYVEHGNEIFSHPRRMRRLLRPKYSRKNLDRVLRQYFGDLRMDDLILPTCITAYEALNGKPRVYKTKHHPGLYWGHEQLVWKVAAATSAAPTYFAPVQIEAGDGHVDGGVWANNPSLVGITEAVHRFGRSLNDIRLISVGTTAPAARLANPERAARMGLVGWARPAFELLQGGPGAGIHFQALQLLGTDHYLRIDDQSHRAIKLDDVAACLPLRAVGTEQARARFDEIKRLLEL
jgi:patatin-like phospholipase/acyl hydrolase